MKNLIRIFALVAVVVLGFTSCSKENMKSTEVRNVTLDIALGAGETYSLDLSPYGVQHATVATTKEALNTSGSKLTTVATTPFNANYQYIGNCEIHSDQVVLLVQEDDGSKGSGTHNGGGNGGQGKTEKCGNGKTPHPAATNITINFTVAGCSTN